MQELGIMLPGHAGGENPWQSSTLLSQAFVFSCDGLRNAKHPEIMVMDPSGLSATLIVKADFLCREDMFDVMREAVPDLLREHTGRVVLARARWKELWATRPSS